LKGGDAPKLEMRYNNHNQPETGSRKVNELHNLHADKAKLNLIRQ